MSGFSKKKPLVGDFCKRTLSFKSVHKWWLVQTCLLYMFDYAPAKSNTAHNISAENAHSKKPHGREVAILTKLAASFWLQNQERLDQQSVLSQSTTSTILCQFCHHVFNQQGLHYHQHCLLSQTLCTADLPDLVQLVYEYIWVCVQLVQVEVWQVWHSKSWK